MAKVTGIGVLAGDVVQQVQGLIEDESEDTLAEIYRWLNLAIREVESRHTWPQMLRVALGAYEFSVRTTDPLEDEDGGVIQDEAGVDLEGEDVSSHEYSLALVDYLTTQKIHVFGLSWDPDEGENDLHASAPLRIIQVRDLLKGIEFFGDRNAKVSIDLGETVNLEWRQHYSYSFDWDSEVYGTRPTFMGSTALHGLPTLRLFTPTGKPYYDFAPTDGDPEVLYQVRHDVISALTDTILIPAPLSVMNRTLAWAMRNSKYDTDARMLGDEFERNLQIEITACQALAKIPNTLREIGHGRSMFDLRNARGVRSARR